MNFQQLRIIQEAIRCNFNLTETANALFTVQSGVSKHIKDLEEELGIELFIRRGKRVLGLTEAGKEVSEMAKRILRDAKNIRELAAQFSARDEGHLRIATTHTQARYALPPIVRQFKNAFPKVHLALHQASPGEIRSLLLSGEVEIGIATEALCGIPDILTFPFYDWYHAVVVLNAHPLTCHNSLTLEAIADYPIITYHEGFTGRKRIDARFSDAGLIPDIVLSALDADVIKTYVELDLGVGIIASMAYHPERDSNLSLLNATHLFDRNTTWIAIHRGRHLRNFAHHFISICNPALGKPGIEQHLAKPARDNTGEM